MIAQIVKFLNALNSNRNPSEIANAFCLGLMLGFMPKNNALWVIIFVFFFFVRLHKPTYVITAFLFSQVAWLLDPLFDNIGYKILTIESLKEFYGWLLEIPFVGFTKFNNTIVMGSFVSGLVLYIPMFFLARLFVLVWRKKFAPRLGESALMKTISKAPIVKTLIDLSEDL